MATYLDLLNPDGTRNARVFASILDHRVTAETNLRLTLGMYRPFGMPPGDEPAWRAQIVKERGLGPLGKDELKRIRDHAFEELESFVKNMQRGAGKQRGAMDAAYALAAE